MIFILGLDGLEYNFVEEWNCEELQQKQYGKIAVPINKRINRPTSPEVWAWFLTGKALKGIRFVPKPPLPMGLTTQFLRKLRKVVKVSLGLGKSLDKRIKRLTPKAKRESSYAHFPPLEQLNCETFLDVTNSEEINVPYYSFDMKTFKLARAFGRDEINLDQAIEMSKQIYIRNKTRILNRTKNIQEKDVVFAFLSFPDSLHHKYMARPRLFKRRIKEHYADIEYFVYSLKAMLDSETLFIIVSDHGFDLKLGTHSNYGFFSSNVPLKPRPRRITDFYKIIIEETQS